MINNFKNNYKLFKKSLYKKLKYFNLIDPRISFPENKFVIYTRGRTGSTVLTDLINCHPDIFCDVEIFNFMYSNNRVLFPVKYINSCSKRATIMKKPVYGFKVKISQLTIEHKYKNYENILSELHTKGWKFIYLKRENYLRHKISNILTKETNVFHIQNDEVPYGKKIHIDCKLLLDSILFGEEIERKEEMDLKDIPHLTIVYEKDLLDNARHQQTADRIFDFLGLRSHKVETKYKRVTPENLIDTIINYDEVFDYFKNTKYIDFLK